MKLHHGSLGIVQKPEMRIEERTSGHTEKVQRALALWRNR